LSRPVVRHRPEARTAPALAATTRGDGDEVDAGEALVQDGKGGGRQLAQRQHLQGAGQGGGQYRDRLAQAEDDRIEQPAPASARPAGRLRTAPTAIARARPSALGKRAPMQADSRM
jgi:hypothetical protein